MKRSSFFLQIFCILWLGVFGAFPLAAQDTLRLESAWQAAQIHYPMGGKKALLGEISSLTIANLRANRWLPQLALNGQATWQSEVTQLPLEIPNVEIPSLNKDQYKLTLEANYSLYDGNQLALQQDLERAGRDVEQQAVVVELYRIKDQVNNLFLNALLVDENIRLMQINLSNLQNRMDKLTASVRYGTVSQMNLDELKAQYLQAQQSLAELTATRRGLRGQLSLLTSLPISDSTILYLDMPVPAPKLLPLARPELALYDARQNLLNTQKRLILAKWQPRLSLFAQPGIGRPGLNFLDNSFRSFFIGGLRLNWNLSPMYSLHRERQIQDLKARQITLEQATFELNLSLQMRAQQGEIERLEAVLEKDEELVALRTKVLASAQVMFDNEVIDARDYTTELNAETQARLNQKVHEWQLTLARLQYQILMGY